MSRQESSTQKPRRTPRKLTLEDAHVLAQERDGVCLSTAYANNHTKLHWQCRCGHVWSANFNNLARGQWCPVCAIEKKKEGTFKRQCALRGIIGSEYWRALKRREAGMLEEKIFADTYVRDMRETQAISVFGETYPNLQEAIRALHPCATGRTLARWLKSGMAPEEAFERIPNPGYTEGIVYCVTHHISGKQYVGLTIQTLERRWWYHQAQASTGCIKGAESLHAAIRMDGAEAFSVTCLDNGITKKDLETKERHWIHQLNTLAPSGFNLNSGGVSGGSNKKPTQIDGRDFESVRKAVEYIAVTRGITIGAAKARRLKHRVNAKAYRKGSASLVKTAVYKVWNGVVNKTNPQSRSHIAGIELYEPWRDFYTFLAHVGHKPAQGMAFVRLDRTHGFFPWNCAWVTSSEASRMNAAWMKAQGTLTGRRRIMKA